MPIFYLDYELGSDANDGSSWAQAWKTFTLGATLARIAPGDIIRIAKSPAPTSIGNATWTNLSKTVTLATAQTLNIDRCETAWTGAGDTTIYRNSVAEDAKEGSYCMRLGVDSTPQANILQAYFATGELNLSAYQKISFWIKNSGAIVENNWIVNLCSDTAGATVVDSFLIPAIPSANQWLPLTLIKVGGNNLGASIKSIAIYSGSSTTGMASTYVYVDNFIACTTNGLNLQSLISKNSLEQGGTEGWYGIQSINEVTILLDNQPATKANVGRGYYTSGTSPDTVTTYKRETIKTDVTAGATTVINEVMDSGTLGNNIQFQGGYNVADSQQDGETFFDGLNGYGYGLQLSGKSYITINRLNFSRYYAGIYYTSSHNNTITNILNLSNNTSYGIRISSSNYLIIINIANVNNNGGIYFNLSSNNIITNIGNANNNASFGVSLDATCNNNIITNISSVSNNSNYGLYISASNNNKVETISNANNNSGDSGIYFSISDNNIITDLTNAKNNGQYGVSFVTSFNNIIRSLLTTGNGTAGIYVNTKTNYISNASIAEATEVSAFTAFTNARLHSTNHDKGTNHKVFTDGGLISSEATDRVGGTGIMWKLAITSANRIINYPLKLSVAKIAVVADKLVTVKIWMKKDHATNVGAMLVCPGGQLTGMTVADITATKTDVADTWEQLEISFTPSQQGVVECECWAFYLLANGNIFCEDMEISQVD